MPSARGSAVGTLREEVMLGVECTELKADDVLALVVQSLKGKTLIDGKAAPKGRKLKLRAGSKIKIADEEFTVYRNTHAHA